MADPFEVRMRFTSQLQHLNASVNSSQKAAHYALKYRDMDEDLHSCILEQLERNSMNNRANIMYFIEHLCTTAQRENHLDFVRMMQRDILRVVDAVAPSDGTGAANVKVVRRVLANLQTKAVLLPETVQEIEACLKERDTMPGGTGLSPMSPNAQQQVQLQQQADSSGQAMHGAGEHSNQWQKVADGKALYSVGAVDGSGGNLAVAPPRVDKRQIEQRIEEDRERHKRLRESIWAVGEDGNGNGEFERLWDEVSDIGEDDFLAAEEEANERRVAAEAVG